MDLVRLWQVAALPGDIDDVAQIGRVRPIGLVQDLGCGGDDRVEPEGGVGRREAAGQVARRDLAGE